MDLITILCRTVWFVAHTATSWLILRPQMASSVIWAAPYMPRDGYSARVILTVIRMAPTAPWPWPLPIQPMAVWLLRLRPRCLQCKKLETTYVLRTTEGHMISLAPALVWRRETTWDVSLEWIRLSCCNVCRNVYNCSLVGGGRNL